MGDFVQLRANTTSVYSEIVAGVLTWIQRMTEEVAALAAGGWLGASTVPCSYTCPFDRRRHTLASPGRRSGCLILPRYTHTGCTVGRQHQASVITSKAGIEEPAECVLALCFTKPMKSKIKMLCYRHFTPMSGGKIDQRSSDKHRVQFFLYLADATEFQKCIFINKWLRIKTNSCEKSAMANTDLLIKLFFVQVFMPFIKNSFSTLGFKINMQYNTWMWLDEWLLEKSNQREPAAFKLKSKWNLGATQHSKQTRMKKKGPFILTYFALLMLMK